MQILKSPGPLRCLCTVPCCNATAVLAALQTRHTNSLYLYSYLDLLQFLHCWNNYQKGPADTAAPWGRLCCLLPVLLEIEIINRKDAEEFYSNQRKFPDQPWRLSEAIKGLSHCGFFWKTNIADEPFVQKTLSHLLTVAWLHSLPAPPRHELPTCTFPGSLVGWAVFPFHFCICTLTTKEYFRFIDLLLK